MAPIPRGALVCSALALLLTDRAAALGPPQPVSQFTLVGFLQQAKLDGADVFAGGTLTVNGQVVVVPRNTVVVMPATFLTWQELFTLAPPPYGPTQTGLALADAPAPLTTYEVTVEGNRVGDSYIAGLVSLSQQSLNNGQGYVNYIDYVTGELRVGGVMGDPTSGQRVRLNDPIGRFGRVSSADPRFTSDADNPSVRTRTGYPVCVPRVDPAVAPDPLCPQTNRPSDPASPTGFKTLFTMPLAGPGVTPDATQQAPLEVGDYVTYSGTLLADGPHPSAGPLPLLGTTYVSAWTLVSNVGLFTAPGTDPAYVALDVTLLGVGGVTVAGLVEATTRTRFEGFTTDPSRAIELYGVDVDPCTGAASDRSWGAVDVDQGPPRGAVRGRWRFRPPAAVLSMPPSGTFLPPTREVRARIRSAAPTLAANGILAGQYHAPITTYLFPENAAVGSPIVPDDFTVFRFLAQGSGPWPGGGPNPFPGGVVGQLSPWPGQTPPLASSCAPATLQSPVANAGPSQTVASGSTVPLDGSASTGRNGLPLTFAWTQTSGPSVVLSSGSVARPSFTAPPVAIGGTAVALTFSLTVSDASGPSTPASVTITVAPAAVTVPPIASAGPALTVASGAAAVLDGTASRDPNAPPLALSYAWTQVAPLAPAGTLGGANTAAAVFRAPAVPPGASLAVTFGLTVTSSAGLTSTALVTVTVSPVLPPVAAAGPNQAVRSGASVSLTGRASFDPNGLPLSFTWTQVTGPAVALAGAATVGPSFTAPTLPAGSGPVVLGFTLTVGDGLATSTPALMTVTVGSTPDAVTILSAVYRVAQRRLTVTASSSVPAAQLTLQGVGGGANVPLTVQLGVPTATVVGVGEPAAVTVTSSLGGSATSPITRLR